LDVHGHLPEGMEALWDCEEAALELLTAHPELVPQASTRLLADSAFLETIATRDPRVLKHLPDEHRRNQELVVAAVTAHHAAAEHAHPELLADADFVLRLLAASPRCLCYAAVALRQNRDFMLRAMDVNPLAFLHSEAPLDKAFALAVVARHGPYIACLPQEYRADADVRLAAFAQDAWAAFVPTRRPPFGQAPRRLAPPFRRHAADGYVDVGEISARAGEDFHFAIYANTTAAVEAMQALQRVVVVGRGQLLRFERPEDWVDFLREPLQVWGEPFFAGPGEVGRPGGCLLQPPPRLTDRSPIWAHPCVALSYARWLADRLPSATFHAEMSAWLLGGDGRQ
jgi:hypothetical protein